MLAKPKECKFLLKHSRWLLERNLSQLLSQGASISLGYEGEILFSWGEERDSLSSKHCHHVKAWKALRYKTLNLCHL